MRPIPPALRTKIASDPFMRKCIRDSEATCEGRITWEHTFTYSGKQINERWAIVPLCEHHHFRDLNKNYGRYIALLRATESDLNKYGKANFRQQLEHFKKQFGEIKL